MKLICPGCSGIYSADAWVSQSDIRQSVKILAELPNQVSRLCLAYLSFFRPLSGQGLQWVKVLRLLEELRQLINAPCVKWDKNPDRPNTPVVWAQAMEKMFAYPPKRLPLKSHGYLRSIAWEIADDMDKQAEQRRNTAERTGIVHQDRQNNKEPEPIGAEDVRNLKNKLLKNKEVYYGT